MEMKYLTVTAMITDENETVFRIPVPENTYVPDGGAFVIDREGIRMPAHVFHRGGSVEITIPRSGGWMIKIELMVI